AGLGVLAREELAELLQRRDVVAGSLTQAPAGLLEVAELDVPDDAGYGLGGPRARDRVPPQLGIVAPGHRDHPLLDVPAAELDHHGHPLADPFPALLGWLVVALVDGDSHRQVHPRLGGDLVAEPSRGFQDRGRVISGDWDDLDLMRGDP